MSLTAGRRLSEAHSILEALCAAFLISVQFASCHHGMGPAPLPVARFERFAPGIYRGHAPQAPDFSALKEMGIKTILNLRTAPWDIYPEQRRAEAAGLKVINQPMSVFYPPHDDQLRKILEAMIDPANQPIYIHCKLGLDRTGYIAGMYRIYVEGWDPWLAYAEMRESGFSPYRLPLYYAEFKRRFDGDAKRHALSDLIPAQ